MNFFNIYYFLAPKWLCLSHLTAVAILRTLMPCPLMNSVTRSHKRPKTISRWLLSFRLECLKQLGLSLLLTCTTSSTAAHCHRRSMEMQWSPTSLHDIRSFVWMFLLQRWNIRMRFRCVLAMRLRPGLGV